MGGLPAELHNQCRSVLLRCEEFESDDYLRTVFGIGELFPFQYELRSARHASERVDFCINDLRQKRTDSGEPALAILLATLRDRYDERNARHGELATLHDAVQSALAQVANVSSQGNHFENLRQELLAASQGLLNWQRTLGRNQQIERAEFEQLLNLIQQEKSSTTLILGAPGTGKSALLASLGHYFVNQNVALWAIKADQLGRGVNTLEDLCTQLHLSFNPNHAIRNLAKKETVVLLIDQLDAVSELLDRQSERLNILLNLIQSLSGTQGVHIIATSREFEFRHDIRLSCINAARMDLQVPTWEQIAPLLTEAGHYPESMGQSLRELLQTPLHLKLFLDVAAPGEVFNSLQSLLNKLWEKRVLNSDEPPNRLELLGLLADRMSDDEEFWLPTALAEDTNPLACQALEQAGILTRSPDGLTISFRHQTYYDHTLARNFARGSSLADYVLQRQDGIFVRPVFLSGLSYLRATSPARYHQEIQKLLQSELRLHIRTLLLEFVGGQKDPDNTEAHLLLPLLNSETEAPRILATVVGSPGWFSRLQYHESFRQWLDKSPQKAVYCVPVLKAAVRFATKDVLEVLEDCWLSDSTYDSLTLSVLLNIEQWTPQAVNVAITVVRRSMTEPWQISALMEQVAENNPELAPKVLRAHLARLLEQALEEVNKALPELPPDADEAQRQIHAYMNDPLNPLKHLIENKPDIDNLETLAAETPKAFLDSTWSWFLNVVNLIADAEHPFVVGYRDDRATSSSFEERWQLSPVVLALLVAIQELAKQDVRAFLNFLDKNVDSDLKIVHRLLARGLEQIASQEPQRVLEYLIGDSRRLNLGHFENYYTETKQLITSVCPYLEPSDQARLEALVVTFKHYKHFPSELPAKKRLQFLKWQRQDRLRLLRSFPSSCLSAKTKRLKEEEERALPDTDDYVSHISADFIGSRITVDEMARASDEDILRLFDLLPDATAWDDPKREWLDDLSRAGGAVELSREFSKLAQRQPKRVVNLLQYLKSGQHETYAGAAIAGLVDTDFSTTDLINLIENLENRGFSSGNFRREVAIALGKRAQRDRCLPQAILTRLEDWLANEPEPVFTEPEAKQNETQSRKEPILLGASGNFSLQQGRAVILSAIAVGYTYQQPPDLDNWARVIESQLNRENHPTIWVLTLRYMPILLKGNLEQATQLYDAVIQKCPAILRHQPALKAIARDIRWFEPQEKVQGWLEKLLADSSAFCRQAYGELLFIYYCHHKDTWSEEEINRHLADKNDEDILLGLAYAASYNWGQKNCRKIATNILCTLSSYSSNFVQTAVASIFRWQRKDFKPNPEMRQIIQAVSNNPPVLLEAAYYLVDLLEPLTAGELELVSQVCQAILQAASSEINNSSSNLPLQAEKLTNISITLHRQHLQPYREIGLCIFEKLISLNLREARAALDILDVDRQPTQAVFFTARKRPRLR
ncbi:AAA family ATPase [Scytonema sp. NUACC21]